MFVLGSYCLFISTHGESGKLEVPGNIILLAVCLFNFIRAVAACICMTYGWEQWMSSARMQPIAHISMGCSYILSVKMISGDLYHLEQIWFDRHLGFSLFMDSINNMLAIFCLNYFLWTAYYRES